jgi:hypothetical protein
MSFNSNTFIYNYIELVITSLVIDYDNNITAKEEQLGNPGMGCLS